MSNIDRKEIFLKTQLILAVLPTFITQLIAFYRVHKLIYGIIIEILIFFCDVIILKSVSWPYGLAVFLPISVIIPVYFVKKWTVEYNKTKSLF